MSRFRHDRRIFRTLMPISAVIIGTLAWSWSTYGSAVDAMLDAGARALAAPPIIALEALALSMDLAKLWRKVADATVQEPATAQVGVPLRTKVSTSTTW